MKVTCPDCSGGLNGRRVDGSCERCREVYAAPLTGERNESSVLFSLATLARQAPPPAPAKVTESSALIDIRALVPVGSTGRAPVAPLFAPPVTFAPPPNEERARRGYGTIAIATVAFAVFATASVAAVARARTKSVPAVTVAAAPPPVVAVTAPVEIPSAVTTNDATPPPASAPIASVAPARRARITNVAPPARSATTSTPTAAAATAKPPAKCCPGEADLACQMRLAAGAACGG